MVDDPRITVLQSILIPEREEANNSFALYPEISPRIKVPRAIMRVETTPPVMALLIIVLVDDLIK